MIEWRARRRRARSVIGTDGSCADRLMHRAVGDNSFDGGVEAIGRAVVAINIPRWWWRGRWATDVDAYAAISGYWIRAMPAESGADSAVTMRIGR
ncbi:hypothetical protein [Dactylosporangium sp. CA-092794]|uniref:hypothetical protein n=1 Tax=Dactylosporangium sp. CA-092794 TaxID=3239929 RepID=UPI003D8B16CB